MSDVVERALEDIERTHPEEWVVVEETAWDALGNPVRGVVVAHSGERKAVVRATHEFRARKPGARTFTFYTGAKIPEGVTVVL